MDSPQQRKPIVLRPAGALLLVFLFFAAFMSALMIIASPVRSNVVDALLLHSAVAVGLLMALYIGLNRHAPNEKTMPALRLSWPSRNVTPFLLLAVLTGIALGSLGEMLFNWVLSLWPSSSLSAEQQAQLAQKASPLTFATIVSFAANLAFLPFLEEAFFRGLLQSHLEESIGARRAFAVTLTLYLLPSLLSPQLVPTALLLAAPMGLLALWSRTTWPAVCGHVAFQTSPYLFKWFDVKLVDSGVDGLRFLSWGWVLSLSGGAVAMLAIARSGRQRASLEGTEEVNT